jgi:hypothetical protein
MENTFNLKKFLAEGKLLKEDTNNIYQDFLKTFGSFVKHYIIIIGLTITAF